MHIKHIHDAIEKISEYVCKEACKPMEDIDTKELGEVADLLKDLCEAEKSSRISKAMEEEEKEEEEADKYMLKRIKEEYGDDQEGARRGYDEYRYMRSGRYAPKGRGTFVGRRGYMPMWDDADMDMMYSGMSDADRMNAQRKMGRNVHYYGGESGNSGMNSGSMGSRSGNMGSSSMGGSSSRGYDDGMMEDMRRRGYEDGVREGRRMEQNENRYSRMKRGYEEAKHDGTKDNQHKAKKVGEFADAMIDDIMELMSGSSAEEKQMLRTKLVQASQKIQ